MNKNKAAKVSIVMGSQSDYKIMKLCELYLKLHIKYAILKEKCLKLTTFITELLCYVLLRS